MHCKIKKFSFQVIFILWFSVSVLKKCYLEFVQKYSKMVLEQRKLLKLLRFNIWKKLLNSRVQLDIKLNISCLLVTWNHKLDLISCKQKDSRLLLISLIIWDFWVILEVSTEVLISQKWKPQLLENYSLKIGAIYVQCIHPMVDLVGCLIISLNLVNL